MAKGMVKKVLEKGGGIRNLVYELLAPKFELKCPEPK
jgi:hypothetical protein